MTNPEARCAPRSIEEDAGDVFLVRLLQSGPDAVYSFMDHYMAPRNRSRFADGQPDMHTWLSADGRAFALEGMIGSGDNFRMYEYDTSDDQPAWHGVEVRPEIKRSGQTVTTTFYFKESGDTGDIQMEPPAWDSGLHDRILRGLTVLSLKEQAKPVRAITFEYDGDGRIRPFLVENERRRLLVDGTKTLQVLAKERRMALLEARMLSRAMETETAGTSASEPTKAHLTLVKN